MSLFHITNPKKLLRQELQVEKEGFLTWTEFLELLFAYKRSVKESDLSVVQEEYVVEKNERPEYHTMKEKIRSKSLKARRELDKAFRNERISKSRMASKDYKLGSKSVRHLKEKHLTVPHPFKFNENKKSIMQRRLEEMVGEKIIEEENMMHHQFKANPLPQSTKQPLYEKLKRKEEERREEVKKNSIAATKAREKPFSFYERDKDFYVKRALISEQYIPEEIKNHEPFKATPIPWSVSTLLFDQMMNKEENEREERIRKRSKEIASQSKLPPRMEMHEMAKKQGLLQRPQVPTQIFTFQPSGIRDAPDFAKQQEGFQRALENHKKQKKATVPEPFDFGESKRRGNNRKYMDDENVPQIELKTRKEATQEIAALKKPSINPPSTAKMDALTNKRREQLEARRIKQLKKETEEQTRKEKFKQVLLIHHMLGGAVGKK